MQYNLKDITYSAMTAAAMNVLSYVTVPLVVAVPVPGLRNLVVAPFYGLLMALALMRIDKHGLFTLISFFTGVVLLFISPVILGFLLISGVAADLFYFLTQRGLPKRSRIIGASGLYMAVMAVVGALFGALFLGEMPLGDLFRSTPVLAAVAILCAVTGGMGAVLGIRVGSEFRRTTIMR